MELSLPELQQGFGGQGIAPLPFTSAEMMALHQKQQQQQYFAQQQRLQQIQGGVGLGLGSSSRTSGADSSGMRILYGSLGDQVLDAPLNLPIAEYATHTQDLGARPATAGPAADGGAAFGGTTPGGAFGMLMQQQQQQQQMQQQMGAGGAAAAAAAASADGMTSDSGQEFDAVEAALMVPLSLPEFPDTSTTNTTVKSEPGLLLQQQQQLQMQQHQMLQMQQFQIQQQQQYFQLQQQQQQQALVQQRQQQLLQHQPLRQVKIEPPQYPAGERPHMEGSKWANWVLDMKVKQRNTLAQTRGFTKAQLADLKKETKRYQRARAQQRYHKKRALATGKSYSRPGRPRLEDKPVSVRASSAIGNVSGLIDSAVDGVSGSGFGSTGTSSDQEMQDAETEAGAAAAAAAAFLSTGGGEEADETYDC